MSAGLRSPINWTGGKARLAYRLLPLLPPHEAYGEVFGGSGALLFSKPPVAVEIYNDLDSGLVNFFRVLRDPARFGYFVYKVNLTPYSREEYEFCRRTWDLCECPTERAYRWWVVARQSFGGRFGWGWRSTKWSKTVALGKYLSAVDKLPEFHERMRGVQVEHQDFRKVLSRYDCPEMLWYVDPPYVTDTRSRPKLYEHEMTEDDHRELVELLLGLRGRGVVSGYSHPVYEALERHGWRREDFGVVCPTADERRIESVWISPA